MSTRTRKILSTKLRECCIKFFLAIKDSNFPLDTMQFPIIVDYIFRNTVIIHFKCICHTHNVLISIIP